MSVPSSGVLKQSQGFLATVPSMYASSGSWVRKASGPGFSITKPIGTNGRNHQSWEYIKRIIRMNYSNCNKYFKSSLQKLEAVSQLVNADFVSWDSWHKGPCCTHRMDIWWLWPNADLLLAFDLYSLWPMVQRPNRKLRCRWRNIVGSYLRSCEGELGGASALTWRISMEKFI